VPDFPKSYKAHNSKGPLSGIANSRRRGRAFSSRKGKTPASTGIRFFEMLANDGRHITLDKCIHIYCIFRQRFYIVATYSQVFGDVYMEYGKVRGQLSP
jgi:hypothetical protein